MNSSRIDLHQLIQRLRDGSIQLKDAFSVGHVPETLLHTFACDCAERALTQEWKAGRQPDARLWNAIWLKRRWLEGAIEDQELNDAREQIEKLATDLSWLEGEESKTTLLLRIVMAAMQCHSARRFACAVARWSADLAGSHKAALIRASQSKWNKEKKRGLCLVPNLTWEAESYWQRNHLATLLNEVSPPEHLPAAFSLALCVA